MKKVCLISGGSSGIGLATARWMHAAGYTVYEISRRETGAEGICHLRGDVTDEAQIKSIVEAVWEKEGQLDVIINCAGFGISGAIEFTELLDAKRQFDVNFFGMVNINKAALPYLREQGFGRIVNISSVAGAISIPFQAYYSASKAAINSYTMALANEVRPYGVQVLCAQPGDICTGFTAARKKESAGDDTYGGRISKSVARMEKDEQTGMKAEIAGRMIGRLATKKTVKPINTLRIDYQSFCILAKLLPAKLLNWLVYLIYAK